MATLVIHCLSCRADTVAEKQRGARSPRTRARFGMRVLWWNVCKLCGTRYEALPPGDREERRTQRRLERHGQVPMFPG